MTGVEEADVSAWTALEELVPEPEPELELELELEPELLPDEGV